MIIETSAIKEPDNSFIAEIVVSQVESVYKRASIPTVRKDTIKARVLKVYEKRKRITLIPAARRYNNQECSIPMIFQASSNIKNLKKTCSLTEFPVCLKLLIMRMCPRLRENFS